MKWANPPAHFRRPRSAVALDMIRPGSNFVPGGQHVHALVIILPGASTAARPADIHGIYPVRIGPGHRHWLSSASGQSSFRAWCAGSRGEWRRTMFSPRSTRARAWSRDIVRPPRRGSVRAYPPVATTCCARCPRGEHPNFPSPLEQSPCNSEYPRTTDILAHQQKLSIIYDICIRIQGSIISTKQRQHHGLRRRLEADIAWTAFVALPTKDHRRTVPITEA